MTEIQPADAAPLAKTNPMAIIAEMSLNPDCNPEKLKDLMDLQERWEKRQAQADWSEAMRRFQEMCPPIKKNKDTKHYSYATFSQIMAIIRPHLSACGLSLSFSSSEGDGKLTVVLTISCGTHSETSTYTTPIAISPKTRDGKAVISNVQSYGSTMSYAKRYCLIGALNLVPVDEDDETALASPHADADPHAAKAATRGKLDAMTELYNRWLVASDVKPGNWWAWVAVTIGTPKAEAALTDEDLDKIAHAIGEIESA